MTTDTPDGTIVPGNDIVIQLPITVEDSTTGKYVKATGALVLTDIAVTVAATKGGDPIDGVSLTCAEYSATAGTYRIVIDPDSASTIKAAVGSTCWLHLVSPSGLDSWTPLSAATLRIVS